MFETHFDATYAWLGVVLVSIATIGVAAALPASPPPDASGVAHTIDSVADGNHPATAEHGLTANRIRLTDRSVTLGGAGGTTRSALHAPRITPVPAARHDAIEHGGLRRVLKGVPPDSVFDSPTDLATAAEGARSADHGWRPAPDRITVRRVHYGEVHVTLVG